MTYNLLKTPKSPIVNGFRLTDNHLYKRLFFEDDSYKTILDSKGNICAANESLAHWLHSDANELIGKPFLESLNSGETLIFPEDLTNVTEQLSTAFYTKKDSLETECRVFTELGLRWLRYRISYHPDPDEGAEYFVFIARDVTVLKHVQERLEFTRKHDYVTGMPTLEELFKRMRILARKRSVNGNSGFSLLLVSLDDFEYAEASLGKLSTERLLKHISIRLSRLAKLVEFVGMVDRFSFGVLIPDDNSRQERVVNAVLGAIREPFQIDGQTLYITASIGIARAKTAEPKPETVLRSAQLALTLAIENGDDFYAVECQCDATTRADKFILISDLKQALETNALRVLFQPIFFLDTLKVRGVEALIRWDHPQKGPIPPDIFIPVAEEARLMPRIEHWLIDKCVSSLAMWKRNYKEFADVLMGINISSTRLGTQGLMHDLETIVEKYALNPNDIVIEVTETHAIEKFHSRKHGFNELRKCGFGLALDDFGTGYSSLNYLNTLPITSLKIDKTFVSKMEHDHAGSCILDTIVEMSNKLDLRTVAEGIETASQYERLKDNGCNYGQGYLLSRPLEPEDLIKLVLKISKMPVIRVEDLA